MIYTHHNQVLDSKDMRLVSEWNRRLWEIKVGDLIRYRWRWGDVKRLWPDSSDFYITVSQVSKVALVVEIDQSQEVVGLGDYPAGCHAFFLAHIKILQPDGCICTLSSTSWYIETILDHPTEPEPEP